MYSKEQILDLIEQELIDSDFDETLKIIYNAVIANIDKVLIADKKNLEALKLRAKMLCRVGKYKEAMDDCRNFAFNNHGWTPEMRRVLDYASSSLFDMWKKDSDLSLSIMHLFRDGKFEEGIKTCDEYMKIFGEDITKLRVKAYMLRLLKRYKECVEVCQRMLEIEPDDAKAKKLLDEIGFTGDMDEFLKNKENNTKLLNDDLDMAICDYYGVRTDEIESDTDISLNETKYEKHDNSYQNYLYSKKLMLFLLCFMFIMPLLFVAFDPTRESMMCDENYYCKVEQKYFNIITKIKEFTLTPNSKINLSMEDESSKSSHWYVSHVSYDNIKPFKSTLFYGIDKKDFEEKKNNEEQKFMQYLNNPNEKYFIYLSKEYAFFVMLKVWAVADLLFLGFYVFFMADMLHLRPKYWLAKKVMWVIFFGSFVVFPIWMFCHPTNESMMCDEQYNCKVDQVYCDSFTITKKFTLNSNSKMYLIDDIHDSSGNRSMVRYDNTMPFKERLPGNYWNTSNFEKDQEKVRQDFMQYINNPKQKYLIFSSADTHFYEFILKVWAAVLMLLGVGALFIRQKSKSKEV